MNESTRYPQIVRYLSETPWAILPSALVKIRELIVFKDAGGVLSREEIAERIGAAARTKTPSQGSVAVLPIHGAIVPKADLFTDVSGGTSLESFRASLKAAMEDSSISSIVLDIDSPGGSVEMLAETAAEIRSARDSKHIVAVANTMAASAAYYLAAQASEIVVTPSGQVGSIGTIAIHQDISKALEREGIDPTLVTFGEHKAEMHPFQPLSEEAEAELQRQVDSYGHEFVADVAKGRGVSASVVMETYGQGRMLRAADALSVGMVDRVDTLDATLARLVGGRATTTRRTRAEAGELALAATAGSNPVLAEGGYSLDVSMPAALSVEIARAAPSTASVVVASQTNETRKEVSPMSETIETPRTREDIVARMGTIAARQAELDSEYVGRLMEGDDEAEFEALDAEHDLLAKTLKQIDARTRAIERKAAAGSVVEGDGAVTGSENFSKPNTNVDTRKRLPANVFDLPAYRSMAHSIDEMEGMWKEGARRVVDGSVFDVADEDKVKAHAERLIAKENPNGLPRDSFAHRVLVAGSAEYDRAFGKMVMGRPLSTQEDQLIRAAVGHTGLGAETPVPITIDPSVMLISDGQVNPMREISDVRTITGLTWRGINSEGVTATYAAEATPVVTDTGPDFFAPKANVEKAHASIRMSIEVDQDWPSLRAELSMMLADAKDAVEAEKFLLGEGAGADEPLGLIYALVDDGTAIEETSTLNTFDLEDLIKFKGTLPARWKPRASYLANDAIFDAVRLFGVDEVGPNSFWVDMNDGTPPRLFGKPTYEASYMESDPAAGGEPILCYGDFSRGFVIVDRIGLNVLNAGLVRDTNGALTGEVEIYAYWRNTSLLRTPKAFKLLAVQDS